MLVTSNHDSQIIQNKTKITAIIFVKDDSRELPTGRFNILVSF